nr:verticillium wilt disease resistance protein [Ipomoea batatas]
MLATQALAGERLIIGDVDVLASYPRSLLLTGGTGTVEVSSTNVSVAATEGLGVFLGRLEGLFEGSSFLFSGALHPRSTPSPLGGTQSSLSAVVAVRSREDVTRNSSAPVAVRSREDIGRNSSAAVVVRSREDVARNSSNAVAVRSREDVAGNSSAKVAKGSEWCEALSSSLPNLRVLSLRNCHLSGPIHPSLLKLHSLSVIQLDQNNLSSAVPEFLANLTALSLGNCQLQGEFPKAILQLQTLHHLDLSNNHNLSGGIPEFHFSGSLETVSLRFTSFSGSLPDSIGNLHNLSSIDLSNCNFFGPLPFTMANLMSLAYVDFSHNNFNGFVSFTWRGGEAARPGSDLWRRRGQAAVCGGGEARLRSVEAADCDGMEATDWRSMLQTDVGEVDFEPEEIMLKA